MSEQSKFGIDPTCDCAACREARRLVEEAAKGPPPLPTNPAASPPKKYGYCDFCPPDGSPCSVCNDGPVRPY